MPVRRLAIPARSAAAAAAFAAAFAAVAALGVASLAAAQAAPATNPAAEAPTSAPSTRPVARRLTWDRVRLDAELARREAQAQRELRAAEARHAANPRDADAVRALNLARDELARTRAANEKDRKEQGGEYPLEKAAYLGVATSAAPAVLRKQLRLPDGVGLLVDYVEPGSPAQAAGLQAYDVAVRLNDQILVNPQQLAVLVRTFEPANEVKLTVVREGKQTVLTVKLEQRDVKPLAFVEFGNQPAGHPEFAAAPRAVADVWQAARTEPARTGDQVLVTIRDFGGRGLQTMELVKVGIKGEIRPPYLKRPVHVGGLSEAELQKALADAYRLENVLDPANVSVKLVRRPVTRTPHATQK